MEKRGANWPAYKASGLRSKKEFALTATAEKRGTLAVMQRYAEIIATLEKSEIMIKHWRDYQRSLTMLAIFIIKMFAERLKK